MSQDVCVVKNLGSWLLHLWLHRNLGHGLTWNLRYHLGCLDWRWEHKNAWSLKNLCLDLIWLEVDLKFPLFHFFGVGDHPVELGNALDAIVWSLEEALPDVSHDLLIFSNFRWNAYENAKFWR